MRLTTECRIVEITGDPALAGTKYEFGRTWKCLTCGATVREGQPHITGVPPAHISLAALVRHERLGDVDAYDGPSFFFGTAKSRRGTVGRRVEGAQCWHEEA